MNESGNPQPRRKGRGSIPDCWNSPNIQDARTVEIAFYKALRVPQVCGANPPLGNSGAPGAVVATALLPARGTQEEFGAAAFRD